MYYKVLLWRPRWFVRVVRLSSSGLLRLSTGFLFGLSAQLRRCVPLPGPLYSGLPQSSPSLSQGRSTASPSAESSTTVVQVQRGGNNPLSSLLSRRRGSTLTLSRQSVVYLTDPPITRTPRSHGSGGSFPVCLHRDPHWEQQSFSSALTRLLAMTGSVPHRSSDNSMCSSRYSRPSTYLSPIGRSSTSDPGGLRWSPHLLPILCT